MVNKIILVLLGAGLVNISWLKWANVTVDYGRELYTPWRIICGQVLYKDIASLFGPLPPYFNALLFKIFGVSMMTLVSFNILLVTGITLLIYRFFSYTVDKWVAFFTSAVFLVLFAFQQGIMGWDQGNFSYICPYSYSVTYALFFSLCAIGIFAAHGRSGRSLSLAGIGALVGLTALCRFEIFIFLGVAMMSGFIVKGIIEQWPWRRVLKATAFLLGGFLVPVGIAYLYFSTQLPLSQVIPDIFGFNDHWREILKHEYYQMTIGLDHREHNSIVTLVTVGCYGLVILAFKCLCKGAGCLEKKYQQWKGIILVLIGITIIVQAGKWIVTSFFDFYNEYDNFLKELPMSVIVLGRNHGIFRGIPVVSIVMIVYLTWFLWQHQRDGDKFKRMLPLWTMSVFAFLMLTKVFLNAQSYSEGFVYAMPAAMLFVALFLGFIPGYFEREHKRGYFVRILSSVLAALILINGLGNTCNAYQSRNFYLRSGVDAMLCKTELWYPLNGQIGEIDAFLKNTDKIMGKGSNFVVFPQGVMLNFLTKRPDPLPYDTFMFAEVARFGEKNMLSSFKDNRPDYIVVANEPVFTANDSRSYLYPSAIKAWILNNYHPVWPVKTEASNTITVYKRS